MNLKDKIETPFRINTDLRILFFFDENVEYGAEMLSLNIPGIRIINAENGYFNLKVQLETELSDQKVFLYFPFAAPKSKEKVDFILLDLLIANKELLLDEVADFMDLFQLLSNQRPLVTK
ncbi:hypothetical protein KAJ27_23555 [bacterium]|nr:hypothetical protein [bacterium]